MMNLGTFKLGAIMAAVFAVGVGGTYFGLQQTDEFSSSTAAASGWMTGHVTATVVGPDGEIKAYRQTDNAIVEGGMELIASQLFQGVNYTAQGGFMRTTDNQGSSPIDAIGIGLNATGGVNGEDFRITHVAGCNNVTEDTWTIGTVNQTAAGARAYTNNNDAMIGINGSAQFDGSAGCLGAFDEAGAFDTSQSQAMFAKNRFSSVTLTAPDSLIINWNFQFNDAVG